MKIKPTNLSQTWKSVTVRNSDVGFNLTADSEGAAVGAAAFLDSRFENVKTGILISPPSSEAGSRTTGLLVENVSFKGCDKPVADSKGKVLLSASTAASWAVGSVYANGSVSRNYAIGKATELLPDVQLRGPSSGLPNSPYFERARPQYGDKSADDFVHLKDVGAKGTWLCLLLASRLNAGPHANDRAQATARLMTLAQSRRPLTTTADTKSSLLTLERT